MKSNLVASLLGISAILMSNSALASQVTVGPFTDFNEVVSARVPMEFQTLFFRQLHSVAIPNFPNFAIVPPPTSCAPNQAPSCVLFPFHDALLLGGVDFPQRVAGIAFNTVDDADPATDLRITTIYGVNLNAGDGGIQLGGVSSTSPEFTAQNERFIGADGRIYLASASMLLAQDEIRTFLGTGFDLSMLHGDPLKQYYVFETIIPGTDLLTFLAPAPVPGPTTWLLMASGIVMLGGRALRSQISRASADLA